MPQTRYRVQITAINAAPATPPSADGALLSPEPQEEVFRQTFDELNVPAVIAFLNRTRRQRRKSSSS